MKSSLALILLAGDPERCWKMGQAGRERVLAHFDRRQQVSKFAALYRELRTDVEPRVELASA